MIPTKGDAILEAVSEARKALDELGRQTFSAYDVGKVLQPVASSVELFLRATVLPMSSRSDTFHKLISDLSNVGLGPTEIAQLQDFRDYYNKIKHQPGFTASLVKSKSILKDAFDALSSLVRLSPGQTAMPQERAYVHQLQVAFWDHLTSGDTEVAISLPSDHWTGVSTVDILYVRANDWDAIKAELLTESRFHLGADHFTTEVWDFMCAEGDFLNAGVWEGSYRDLIRILAKYEWREINDELLPGLARQHNTVSVGTALVMSGVDVAAAGAPEEKDELIRHILLRADTEYALSETEGVRACAAQVAELILSVPQAQRRMLLGPLLRKATRRHEGPLPLVLEDGAIVFEFR